MVSSPPASNNSTRKSAISESLVATTAPPEPPPTIKITEKFVPELTWKSSMFSRVARHRTYWQQSRTRRGTGDDAWNPLSGLWTYSLWQNGLKSWSRLLWPSPSHFPEPSCHSVNFTHTWVLHVMMAPWQRVLTNFTLTGKRSYMGFQWSHWWQLWMNCTWVL